MKQLKKTLLTLVALLAVTTGAWATTVTWVTNDLYGTGSAAFTKYDVTVTPSNNDARLSNFFYKQGANTFTTTLGNFTKIEIVFMPESSPLTVSGWDYELIEAVQPDPQEMPDVWEYTSKLTWTGDAESVSIQGAVDFIKSITFTIAEPASGPEVAWTAATKTGTFKMPGGNVTLEPDYYPQATVAEGAVTAADADARATTDDPLVKVDATKLTGAKKLMYFVSNSGTTAPAYDAEGWTDQLPTAEGFTQQGIVYVWYYPVGTDEGVDGATATYSDGDICLQSITARIAAAPTYAVTFAEGVNPEPPAEPEWTASPNTGVTKGQQVTVTYSGTKKVIGVKAEKKGGAAATDLSTINANYTASNGETLTGTLASNVQISIADGATVTLNNVTINGVNNANYEWAGITCLGDATIILSGTNTVKGFYEDYPGIQAAADKTLIINGTGSLTASSNGYGAGIGGVNKVACGNIEIQGGTITATSVTYGAGIGGGDRADCGNITISGGTITATGGEYGAGIGGGRRGSTSGSCGNILISGGTVTATGGDKAAGIGGGRGYNNTNFSSCGTITITAGVTKVTATMGDGATNSIGAGYWGNCGTVTIGGNEGAITTSPYTYEPSN